MRWICLIRAIARTYILRVGRFDDTKLKAVQFTVRGNKMNESERKYDYRHESVGRAPKRCTSTDERGHVIIFHLERVDLSIAVGCRNVRPARIFLAGQLALAATATRLIMPRLRPHCSPRHILLASSSEPMHAMPWGTPTHLSSIKHLRRHAAS